MHFSTQIRKRGVKTTRKGHHARIYWEHGFTGAWPEDRIAAIVAEKPLGRPDTPSDIAGAVPWLASDAGSFVTGTVIPVNSDGELAKAVVRATGPIVQFGNDW
jgi:NAD(P)-dependent dehydrogenase (short-subunit alcohol dehydrogenase family)